MGIRQGSPIFADRTAAGLALAERVAAECSDMEDAVVLALPRVGVPIAAELANRLHAPLDVMIVRKLGVPTQPELAVGAVASGDVLIVNDDVLQALGISDVALSSVVVRETGELHRREALYRQSRRAVDVKDRNVILTDDGVATGATMRAAIESTRMNGAKHIVVAVPHGAGDAMRSLHDVADQVVCLSTPEPYCSVASWYEEFQQLDDSEVIGLLEANHRNGREYEQHALDSSGTTCGVRHE